jgi:hypothetical protein
MSSLRTVVQAESIIQRDAILSALSHNGIEAFSGRRDISRKIADNTLDLAFEGYSAIFEGFAIQVAEEDFTRAKEIVDSVLREARVHVVDGEPKEDSHFRRFYFCALFTLTLPIVMHVFAIQHLIQGIKKGEELRPVYILFSMALLIFTGVIGVYFVIDYLSPKILAFIGGSA